MFCLALRPGLKRFRQEFEGEGVEAFAYMDDGSLGLTGIAPNPVRAFAFLRRKLDEHRYCGQRRQNSGTTTQRARPDGGEDFVR